MGQYTNLIVPNPRRSVSQTTKASIPFEKIKKNVYILIKKCCLSLLQPLYNPRTDFLSRLVVPNLSFAYLLTVVASERVTNENANTDIR